MPLQLMDFRKKCFIRSLQRLIDQSSCQVSCPDGADIVVQSQSRHCRVLRCVGNQAQAFLAFELYRGEAMPLQHNLGIHYFIAIPNAALAYQRQRQVRFDRQATHRPFTGRIEHNVQVQEVPDQFQRFNPDAGMAQAGRNQYHKLHGAHFFSGQRLSNRSGMGAQDIDLQLFDVLFGDSKPDVLSKTSIYTVYGRTICHHLLQRIARSLDSGDIGLVELHFCIKTSNRDQLFQGNILV